MMRPGRSIIAVALAAASVVATVPGGGNAATVGPNVVVQPSPFAMRGQAIPVTAYATCETSCNARLYWRVPVPTDTKDLGTTGDVKWSSIPMTLTVQSPLVTTSLYTFVATIPGSKVDVRGIDYLVRVDEHGAISYWPGTSAALGIGQKRGLRLTWWHVYVTNPSTIHHVPVATAAYRKAIPIAAEATCAKACSARLWYRRTGLLNPSFAGMGTPPAADGASAKDEQWVSVAMSVDAINVQEFGKQYGAMHYRFSATIPSSHVDTRGVDYALQISDGTSRMFWPGVPYNGYYYAFDGLRTGWQHVYVPNPVLAVHEQATYSSARNVRLRLTARLLCVTPRCSMAVEYNYLGGPLKSIGMTKSIETPLAGVRLETYEVTVPASAVRTGTFAYRFVASDGHTRAYSPGTFANGYYAKLTGVPLAQYVIIVF